MPKPRPIKHKSTKNLADPNKEPLTIMKGTVVKRLPNAHFEVQLENGHLLKEAYVAGRMRKHYIQIALGDVVKVALSHYDLSKGRIIFRGEEDKPQDSMT